MRRTRPGRDAWGILGLVVATCAAGTLAFLLVHPVPSHGAVAQVAAAYDWRPPPWADALYHLGLYFLAGASIATFLFEVVRRVGVWRTGNPTWPNR